MFRHFVASVTSVVIPTVLLVVVYFVLLIIAIFTGTGLGSPISLPLWVAFVFVISTIYTAILLFPSALMAEAISSAFGKWQHIAQIPISMLVLVALILAASFTLRLYPDYSEIGFLHLVDNPIVTFIILLIPLGIYWWTMKIVQTGISIPTAFLKSLGEAYGARTQ